MNKVKFDNRQQADFSTVLRRRVNDYFETNRISKKGNGEMTMKIIIIFLLFICSYAMLLSNRFNQGTMVVLAIILGCSMAMIVFNISHDATHNAISTNPGVNSILSYTFNLIGLNRYIWEIKHNHSHHGFTNISQADADIQQVKFARLHRYERWNAIYKYQHIYLPILWAFFTIQLIFIKDFMLFSQKQLGNVVVTHPAREYFILVFSKVFFVVFTIVVPLLVIHLPWQNILIGVLLKHICCSYVLAMIIIPVHLLDDATFPEPNEDGKIDNSWFVHQLETTCDFAPDNRLLNWCCGASNLHVAHHLFPSVCHVHYCPITRIIRDTAREYGLNYRSKSFPGALLSHLKYLKKIGSEGQPPRIEL